MSRFPLLATLLLATLASAHDTWDDRTDFNVSSTVMFKTGAYGGGRFLIAGYGTGVSCAMYTSINGRTDWTPQALPYLGVPESVAHGAGTFVVADYLGKIYTSPTGETGTWIERTSGVNRHINSVRYLNGMFVAGVNAYQDPEGDLDESYTEILTSPTGETWTSHKFTADSATLASFAYNVTDFAFKPGTAGPGSGTWVIGVNVTNTFLSADESFTTLTRVGVTGAGGDQHIAYGSSKFVVASATAGGGRMWYSATGTGGWTQITLPGGITVSDMSGIFHDGDRFVATGATITGSNPPVPAILHSTDGVTWTQAATVPSSSTNLLFAFRADGLWLTGGTGKTLFTSGASSVSLAEVQVESPVDSVIADGAAINLGVVKIGESTTQTVRLRNIGDETLSGLALTLNGAHASNFSSSPLGVTSLAPGEFLDLTVTFSPKANGNRIAGLHIASNDYDENPFDITLNGTGSPELIVTPGLAQGGDDPGPAQTALPGTLMTYGLSVEVAKSTAPSMVVWLTAPEPSDGVSIGEISGISHAGVYTDIPVTVSGASVPARSVYWTLGSLGVGKLDHRLTFDFALPQSVADGTTYSNSSGGVSSGIYTAAPGSALLTIGAPNLPPAGGTVGSTAVRNDNLAQITLTCTGWQDPEGNGPLTYELRRILPTGGEQMIFPDQAPSQFEFGFTLSATPLFFNVRIKDALGHVHVETVMIESPADIEVTTSEPALIVDGGSVNLGDVALGGVHSATLSIRNRGLAPLTGLAVTLSGADAASFVVTSPAGASNGLLEGTVPIAIRFVSAKIGAHSALLRITSNDADESPFDITLTATGITAVSTPVVKTTAATAIADVAATLNGTVNANGDSREIWFEYGPTTNLGTSIAADPANLGNGSQTVTARLTGLASHTRYHYRLRAAGPAGGASGAVMSFITANTLPAAVADSFKVTLSSTVPLNVLQNDLSPDGDVLSVASNTALVPASAGKLTKSGNTFVFAASYIFNGASFTYTAKDAFGGVSAPVTVTLIAAPCLIDPAFVEYPAAGISYPVTVTTAAMWSVTETLPWVTVTPASGAGNGSVTVTLQPNTSKTPRSGTVMIGGYPHDIDQLGVEKPTLQMPDSIPQGIVAGDYELLIPTTNFPVTYTVTNLPPGLTINANTGLISGSPTKSGKFSVTVKAKNAAGSADLSPTFDIKIAALGEGVIGTFHGLVDPQATINGDLGSRLEITTTKTGTYSGKLITGGTSTPLKGLLDADIDHLNEAYCTIEFPRTSAGPLIMELTFSHDAHSILGTVTDSDTSETSDVHAWRNTWTTANRATPYGGLYTFVLAPTDFDPSLPQGYGFGSFKLISDTTGAITVSGKVADGNTFTCGTFIGPYGEILVYQSLYGGKGSLAGMTSITLVATPGEHTLNNFLNWFKPAPAANSKDTLYQSGFGPLTLNVKGGRHPEIPAGGLVMNLTPGDTNARIDLAGGGLDTEGKEFGVTFSIQNPSATGKINKAVIPTNTSKLTMPTLNAATGAFSGDFTLAGATTAQNRKVPYQGQIVRTIDGIEGFGYFILPESIAATATRRSGNALLGPVK